MRIIHYCTINCTTLPPVLPFFGNTALFSYNNLVEKKFNLIFAIDITNSKPNLTIDYYNG